MAGALSASLAVLTSSFVGSAGVAGVFSAKLPVLKASFSAGQGISGSINTRLPGLLGRFTSLAAVVQLDTLVVATATMTTVRYANYPYNSFAAYGGKYFAAGPTGIFQIDVGETDNNTAIDAYFETGTMDFEIAQKKRVSDFYIAMRASGQMVLDVTVDEVPVNSYVVDPLAIATLNARRSWIGKGAHGKYWHFKFCLLYTSPSPRD